MRQWIPPIHHPSKDFFLSFHNYLLNEIWFFAIEQVSSVRRSFAENFNFQSSNDSVCFCFYQHTLNTVLKIEVLSKTTSTLRNQISRWQLPGPLWQFFKNISNQGTKIAFDCLDIDEALNYLPWIISDLQNLELSCL